MATLPARASTVTLARARDLDGDGKDELYVAGDDQGELKHTVWKDGRPVGEVVLRRSVPGSVLTWNLLPVPAAMLDPTVPVRDSGAP